MKLGNFQFDSGEKVSYKSFFKAYGHNWSRVCICNAVMLLCNILSMLIGFAIVMFMVPFIFPFFVPDSLKDFLVNNSLVSLEDATPEMVNNIYYLVSLILEMLLTGFMFVINGPVQCGITYYMRNLIDGAASFKEDFKKGVKENWKKSLAASFLSIITTCILIFNIGYYRNVGMGAATMFVQSFFTWCMLFWGCMQLYVYPLISCTDLSLKDVYRNAALFCIKGFFSTMGIFILQVILFFVLPFALIFYAGQTGYAIVMLFYLIFSFGFVTFLGTYQSWKLIQKYVDRNHGDSEYL